MNVRNFNLTVCNYFDNLEHISSSIEVQNLSQCRLILQSVVTDAYRTDQ